MVGAPGLCPLCSTDRVARLELDAITDRDADAPEESAPSGSAPFELSARYTGRAAALAQLDAMVARTCESGELSFALLIGEPGMGKTSTVVELARIAAAARPALRFLVGEARGAGVLYAPFAEILAIRFGTGASDGLDASREKILAGVAEVMPPARVTETAHLVAHLMRVPFPDSPVLGPLADSPQQLQARSFLALRRFLAADAAVAPVVLCLENLEAFEPESINLLQYLAAGLSRSPVVILGTARERVFERHPSTGKLDVTVERIDLGPLEQPEAESLLRELCRPLDGVSPRLLEHAAALGGSPRALVELVRYLLESDLIVSDGASGWRIDDGALAAVTLPATHEQLIAERIRIMAEADRALLQMAAVIGETFWLDGVVALLRVREQGGADPDGPTLAQIAAAGDRSRATAAAVIDRLIEREWVQPIVPSSVAGELEYRFHYPHLWSAVYESTVAASRRAAHRTVAQYLELRPEGRGAMAQEEIGRHLELGGDGVGAAGRYRRAADFARASFFNGRAIRLYHQSLACLGEADLAARIDVWHDLGSVDELRGDYEAALGAFERMLRLAWVCASRSKSAVAFNKMGRVWRRKGDIKLALEYLERGLELFEQADDQRGIAGSLDDIGSVLHLLGRTDEAFEKVSQALSALGGGDRRSRARSLSNLGNIQRDRGQFAEALGCHREALDIRRAIGDRVGVIASRSNLAVLAFQRGDRVEARRGWEQALGEAEAIGALPLQALALCNLGELALGEGRTDEARRRLEESLGIAQEIDDRRIEGEATRNLAVLEHGGGDAARARVLALRAHEVAAAAGLRDTEGRALLTLGQVFAVQSLVDTDENTERGRQRAGHTAMADVYFARGIDLLRELGNESELARGLERFGRYKIESGDIAAGRDLLREALGIFQRLGVAQPEDLAAVLSAV
ncbi:MAG TPA: tetratricopeptide repeat protein [Kofleriaceae bacterium]|nr:tetratricopeptide repeat protein [Kofleriaceae bacterium]